MAELSQIIGASPEELEAFAARVERDDAITPAPEVVDAHFARLIASLMREVEKLKAAANSPALVD